MIVPSTIVLVVFCGFMAPPGVGLLPTGPPQDFVAALPSPGLAALGLAAFPEVLGMFPISRPIETADLGRSGLGDEMEGQGGPREAGARGSVAFALIHGQPGRSSYDQYLSVVRDRLESLREARRSLDG